jgi:hypothetical protein
MNQIFDYKNIRSFETIQTAKAMVKYSIIVQEQMLLKSFADLRKNFIGSLKQSAWQMGMKIAADFLVRRVKIW